MKINELQSGIISKYKIINALAQKPKTNPNIVPIWGINYNDKVRKGFVTQMGRIELGKSHIEIISDNVSTVHKPFFSTWKRTLKKIDKMLNTIINKFNDNETVKLDHVEVMSFKNDSIENLRKVYKNLVK